MTGSKTRAIDGRRWGLFRLWDIRDLVTGDLYLRRIRIVETPMFGIKLHHIVGPDPGRALHDHPYSFVSLILWGGYIEQTGHLPGPDGAGWTPYKARGPYRWHWMPATRLHRITHLPRGHAWTLVLNGRRVREWGFSQAPGDWVDAPTYLAGLETP